MFDRAGSLRLSETGAQVTIVHLSLSVFKSPTAPRCDLPDHQLETTQPLLLEYALLSPSLPSITCPRPLEYATEEKKGREKETKGRWVKKPPRGDMQKSEREGLKEPAELGGKKRRSKRP